MGLFGERDRDRRFFEMQTLRLLRLIANRLEITMADIDTLNSEVAQVAADEASIANDVKNVLDELKAQQTGNTPVDLSGPIAALSALHTKLQSDDAALAAAEPAAAPATPPVSDPAPVDTTPAASTDAPTPASTDSTEPPVVEGTVTIDPPTAA